MGNWSGSNEPDEYHWSQDEADAVVWKEDNRWKLGFSLDYQSPWVRRDLGPLDSPKQAIRQAEELIKLGYSTEEYLGHREAAREKIQSVLRNRNEDGMIRLPWRDKGPYVVQMSQDGQTKYLSRAGMEDLGPGFDTIDQAATFENKRDAQHFAGIATRHFEGDIAVVRESEAKAQEVKRLWYRAAHERGGNAWHRESDVEIDGEPSYSRASIWQNKQTGKWEMEVKEGYGRPWEGQFIGEPDSLEEALTRAEEVFQEFEERLRIHEDLRTVINLANEVEDRTVEEQASLERLQRSLERSPDRSLERGGRDDR
jgi:hypothetical protein